MENHIGVPRSCKAATKTTHPGEARFTRLLRFEVPTLAAGLVALLGTMRDIRLPHPLECGGHFDGALPRSLICFQRSSTRSGGAHQSTSKDWVSMAFQAKDKIRKMGSAIGSQIKG